MYRPTVGNRSLNHSRFQESVTLSVRLIATYTYNKGGGNLSKGGGESKQHGA
jgi:hypothetical protein